MSSEINQKSEIVAINYFCSAGTNVGRMREHNEDRFVFDPENGFFMVVDGMGGHEKGEIASQIAAETVQTGVRRIENSAEIRLRDSIILANNTIYDQAQSESTDMGCVLTALLIEDNLATIGHVGDTRLYKIQDGKLNKISSDHSIVGILEEAGELSERRLLEHPQRNEVTKAVGVAEKSFDDADFVDILLTTFESNSAFLICSDGLSDLLTSAEILEIIEDKADFPQMVVEKLIDQANEFGGKDNITVIFIAGKEFVQEIQNRKNQVKTSLSKRVLAVLINRWMFLLYGLLLGGLIVFWLIYRIYSTQIELPIP